MMEQDNIPEWIDKFNNGELTGAELTAFVDLLNHNPELRAEVRLDKELNEILEETDIIELRKKIIRIRENAKRNNPGRRIFLIAASVLILISLSVALFFIFGNKQESHPSFTKEEKDKNRPFPGQNEIVINHPGPDKVIQEPVPGIAGTEKTKIQTGNEILLASNYTPLPAFESLAGSQFRSGEFRLKAPAPGTKFRLSDPLQFTWDTGSGQNLALTILDNKGAVVLESGLLEGKSFKLSKGIGRQGLFYFKFINDNEIIYFGKIVIE